MFECKHINFKPFHHLSVADFFFCFTGSAHDSLARHRGYPFTTKDQDNDSWDRNCAVSFKGAWWYTKCHDSNLNSLYHQGGLQSSRAVGINWKHWKGHEYSMKRAEMKIRPVIF